MSHAKASKAPRELKDGDRLWISLAEDPSEFELAVAEQLAPLSEIADLAFVQIHPWRGTTCSARRAVKEHLLQEVEIPRERLVSFFHIGGRMDVGLPVSNLSFSNAAEAGSIQINKRNFSFSDQTIIVIACPQSDRDVEGGVLGGIEDAVGLLSLALGSRVFPRSLFSAYFCRKSKKFVTSDYMVVASTTEPEAMLGLNGFYGLKEFAVLSEKSHAALWFAGSAAAAQDHASKIIYYNTALEVLCGKNMQNFFRQLYRARKELSDAAAATVRKLQQLRGLILHQGRPQKIPAGEERGIQLLLMDGLIRSETGVLERSAFENFVKMRK
ncbi:hypothetical protein PZ740_05065 [Rhodospirillales bacterium YIM 152171]|uniref:Uncharacterized protein n=2 Tax=Marinimicrococcus flavescens TaxID=3031815 RepID=A0AAP3UYY1_9PROT|nr:hypothetical protein [Marinimicrococcus flavescens]